MARASVTAPAVAPQRQFFSSVPIGRKGAFSWIIVDATRPSPRATRSHTLPTVEGHSGRPWQMPLPGWPTEAVAGRK